MGSVLQKLRLPQGYFYRCLLLHVLLIQQAKTLSVSSTRMQYGHLVPKTVAKLQPDNNRGSYPFFTLTDANQGNIDRVECLSRWNPGEPSLASHLTRVEALRSDPMVAFLLLVVHHWNTTKATFGNPILRVVAAPSMTTSDTPAFSHDANGHIESPLVADYMWSPLPPFVQTQELLSPLIAASGGSFCDGSAPALLPGIIDTTHPLVFKSAFTLAGSTKVAGVQVWRSWFLLLGCNAPVGLTWKLESSNLQLLQHHQLGA
jgi:hypothetical protein